MERSERVHSGKIERRMATDVSLTAVSSGKVACGGSVLHPVRGEGSKLKLKCLRDMKDLRV